MDAELTNRSRDALAAAGNRAVTEGHPDLTPAHLLLALLAGQENENITDLLAAGRRRRPGRRSRRGRACPRRAAQRHRIDGGAAAAQP